MMSPAISVDASVDGKFRDMIRRAFGRSAAKKAAPWANVSHHTVEQWIQCRREPGLFSLLRMIRHPGFRAELRAYLDLIENQEAAIAIELERIGAEPLCAGAGVPSPRGSTRRPTTVCAEPAPTSLRHRAVKP